jgi:hypothetical protein
MEIENTRVDGHATDTEACATEQEAHSKSYKVGYCRPPKHTQWKNGQTGNPKRIRKRKMRSVVQVVNDCFAAEVVVVENGMARRCSAFEVIVSQLLNKATSGNTRAINVLTKYKEFAASRAGPPRVKWLPDEDYFKYLREDAEINGKR